MITDNRVLGAPLVPYIDTKANIEALPLTAADAGASAWATDVELLGTWNGTEWLWGSDANSAYTLEPTGFIDPGGIVVSWSVGDATITLTHSSGKIQYLWRGKLYELTSPWESDSVDEVEAVWYLYSTDGETFAWSTSGWSFSDLQVALVRLLPIGSNTIPMRECHGLMEWQVHEVLHKTVGTYRVSGGLLTAGSYALQPAIPADTDNHPGTDAFTIQDEDAPTSQPAWTYAGNYYHRLSLTGSGAVAIEEDDEDNHLFMLPSGWTYPAINVYSGTWGYTEATTGKYLNLYQVLFPTTADAYGQANRIMWLQPQRAYSTLAAAEAEDFRTVSLGNLTSLAPEFVVFARVTLRTSASYTTIGKVRIEAVSYLTGSRASQVVVALASVVTHDTLEGRDLVNQHPASAITDIVTLAATEPTTPYVGQIWVDTSV